MVAFLFWFGVGFLWFALWFYFFVLMKGFLNLMLGKEMQEMFDITFLASHFGLIVFTFPRLVLYSINTEKIMKEGRKLSCADVEDVFFCVMVYLSSVKVNTFTLSFDLFVFF